MVCIPTEIKTELIQISACDPRSLIEAGWHSRLDEQDVNRLSNHLQVTIKNQAFIYDFSPEKPVLVDELDEMDRLNDPNQYIETGF